MRKFHLMAAALLFAASPAAATPFQIAQAPETSQCTVVAQEPGPIIGQAIDALVVVDDGDNGRSTQGDGNGYATRAEAQTALETIDACES